MQMIKPAGDQSACKGGKPFAAAFGIFALCYGVLDAEQQGVILRYRRAEQQQCQRQHKGIRQKQRYDNCGNKEPQCRRFQAYHIANGRFQPLSKAAALYFGDQLADRHHQKIEEQGGKNLIDNIVF